MPAPIAASAADITAILGPIDEVVMIDILRTGASAEDVLEAFSRLESDEAVGPVAQRGAAAQVVEVMTILEAAEISREKE